MSHLWQCVCVFGVCVRVCVCGVCIGQVSSLCAGYAPLSGPWPAGRPPTGAPWLEFLKTIICSVCARDRARACVRACVCSDIKAEPHRHEICLIGTHTLTHFLPPHTQTHILALFSPPLLSVAFTLESCLRLFLWIWFKTVTPGDISAHFQGLTVAIYRLMSCKWGSCTNKTLVSSHALKLHQERFLCKNTALMSLSYELKSQILAAAEKCWERWRVRLICPN